MLTYPCDGDDTVRQDHSKPVRKVLIADDDITNRLVLQGFLNKHGFTVLHAENGSEAIEIFRSEQPDLVLMDVMMPVMDGYEATLKIKAECNDKFVPVIFLTAMTDEEALAKCIESGGDDFLTKPFNHVILNARIHALVRIQELYNTVHKQKNEIALHQERMEREAKVAETLFTNILHSGSLQKPNIKYLLSPMSLFNGDMLIAAECPSGGINVMLGDFTGHGLAAATGALPASTIFYEMSSKGYSVAEIVTELNSKMNSILPTGMFLAACVMCMDPISHTVSIWNGGIPDGIIYSKKDNNIKSFVKSSHLPLGIIGATEFDNRIEVIDLNEDDRVYLYSDGVTETTNPENKMFGQERLETLFSKNIRAENLFDEINSALNEFRKDSPQDDDVTLAEVVFNQALLGNTEKLKQLKGSALNPASHWQLSLQLQADVLKNSDPLPIIIQAITEIQGLNNRRQQLYTIVAELYSNALEHGLLNLDSKLKTTPDGFAHYYQEREKCLAELNEGSIRIDLKHVPRDTGGRLAIRVEDSGLGFNYKTKQVPNLENNSGNSGRGVPLLNNLCESITHFGKGNIVEVIYVW